MATENKQEVTVSTKRPEIRKISPARVVHPLGEFDRLFHRILGRDWMRPLLWEQPLWSELPEPFEGRLPPVDVIDRDEQIVVRAEIPGVDKKDLDLSIDDNVLTIKGGVSREEKEEQGDYYRREISSGAFSRSVILPANVDASKVNASLRDGLLEVTLTKVEKSKRQRIEVQ